MIHVLSPLPVQRIRFSKIVERTTSSTLVTKHRTLQAHGLANDVPIARCNIYQYVSIVPSNLYIATGSTLGAAAPLYHLYVTRVRVIWEDGVCDGYSRLPVAHGGREDAATQAVEHMRRVLGARYPEMGNLLRIEVTHPAPHAASSI